MRNTLLQAESVEAATKMVFGPDGPIVAAGYEIRPSQKALALATARQIDNGKGWALAEAPCGTGKGIAYLIPGIIAAIRAEEEWKTNPKGQRFFPKVVVSTANIALQSQLVKKDIPGVAKILGIEVRSVLYKGRNNYLCLSKLQDLGGFGSRDEDRLSDWSQEKSCTGDREDLDWNPGRAWSEVSVMAKDCHGKRCPFHSPERGSGAPKCFSERARAGMTTAHVVVVNHYMLSVQRPIPAVLLAVDEAHDLEDCVRRTCADSISDQTGEALANKVAKVLDPIRANKLIRYPLEGLFMALELWVKQRQVKFSEKLPENWHRGTFDPEALKGLSEAAKQIMKQAKNETDDSKAGKLEKLADRVKNAYERAVAVANGFPTMKMEAIAPGPWAIWVSVRMGRELRITANMAPADISTTIMRMQRSYPRAVLASATLAVEGKFKYLRTTLGLAEQGEPALFEEQEETDDDGFETTIKVQVTSAGPTEQLVLPSPFDLPAMGLLVVPRDAPPAKNYGQWKDWAPRAVVEIVRQAGGRTLILASSRKMMEAYGFAIRKSELPYEVRVQGEQGRDTLLKWFKEDVTGVLVATKSFFQGVDVSGESLSCLVLDRIPFDPPGDPLEEAVGKLMVKRDGGGQSFWKRSFPKACQLLAQAAGRLIRSLKDRGVMAILDTRVIDGGSMSRGLRASLPGFPLSRDMRDISNRLAGEELIAKPMRSGSVKRRKPLRRSNSREES